MVAKNMDFIKFYLCLWILFTPKNLIFFPVWVIYPSSLTPVLRRLGFESPIRQKVVSTYVPAVFTIFISYVWARKRKRRRRGIMSKPWLSFAVYISHNQVIKIAVLSMSWPLQLLLFGLNYKGLTKRTW